MSSKCTCGEIENMLGLKGFMYCQEHAPKIKLPQSKKKHIKHGEVLHAFEFDGIHNVLYDDRETDHNNFVLKSLLSNNKFIISTGVNNILSFLNNKNVDQSDYLEVEKHLMEGVI